MPKALTILPENPFAEYLDFQFLRKEGLDHLAGFSGEIWTDHNLHDPGITILEALIYAILDLGYRNQLPIEELLATDPEVDAEEDNFFTASQILSCNPLTILDYRKLLLDIDGVRNAWLEVAQGAEAGLFVDCQESELTFTQPASGTPLLLNGLYRVYLELENPALEDSGREGLSPAEIVSTVKRVLNQHRNLCEDFLDVIVLEKEDIAVCAEIELASGASPEDTMLKILETVQEFLSPTIPFYTLKQLIQKGKRVEEIFEGRPYTQDSHGFIDPGDLEKLERRREIHTSDLYNILLKLPEIRGIKKLFVKSYIDGNSNSGMEPWSLSLDCDRHPSLSSELSAFTFFKGELPFNPDKKKTIARFKKRLSNFRKTKLRPYDLDLPIPEGKYREDLEEYRSVQNEFPLVYGIGEGELAPDAPEKRIAQALQLKGYLLFFDQLLANYLSQLSNIRHLFSFQKESERPAEGRQTYFVQALKDVPRIEELLVHYQVDETDDQFGQPFAYYWPGEGVPTPTTPESRDMAILSLRRILEKGSYIVRVEEEGEEQFRFIICNQAEHPFVKSAQHYLTEAAALEAAQMLKFLGFVKDAYKRINRPLDHEYTFQIVYRPLNYLSYLDRISESQTLYCQRRDEFLNHLLARFSEHFTDYVLLMFALNGQQHDPARTIRDKTAFLSQYPNISRNRGRAYNYQDEEGTWNTGNITGVEQRVKALMGIPDWSRRTLSNFKVAPYEEIYRFQLISDQGSVEMASTQGYASESDAWSAYVHFLDRAANKDNYEPVDCRLDYVYSFQVTGTQGERLAVHAGSYPTPYLRDEALNRLSNWIRQNLSDLKTQDPEVENVFVPTPLCLEAPGSPAYRFLLIDEEEFFARHPKMYKNISRYREAKTELMGRKDNIRDYYSGICLGQGAAVVRMGRGKYRYQLVDLLTDEVLWRSFRSFATEEAAFTAFQAEFFRVVEVARNQGRYLIRQEEGTPQLFLKNEEGEDWVYAPAVPEETDPDLGLDLVAKRRFLHARCYPVVRIQDPALEEGCDPKEPAREQYSFRVIFLRPEDVSVTIEETRAVFELASDGTVDWEGVLRYPTVLDAWKGFQNFLTLLANKDNWLSPYDQKENKYGIALGEVMLAGQQFYSSAEAAWEGTKDFLYHIQQEDSAHPFLDYGANCHCSFRVGSGDYRIATHPYHYSTPAEREVVLSCLQARGRKREKFFSLFEQEIFKDEGNTSGGSNAGKKYSFGIREQEGGLLWRSTKFFATKAEAERAYEKEHLSILELAKWPEHYDFLKTGGTCTIQLRDEKGAVVAVVDTVFQAAENRKRFLAIRKRIILAWLNPVVQAEDGDYRFELFDFGFDHRRLQAMAREMMAENGSSNPALELPCELNDEDILSAEPSSDPENAMPGDCGEEEKKYLKDLFDASFSGEVVLVSVKTYSNRHDLDCALDWLAERLSLFRRADSYQRDRISGCVALGIDFVNPNEILARHPRTYLLDSECEQALQRMKGNVNAEGFHVLEHILLRPAPDSALPFHFEVKDAEGESLAISVSAYPSREEAALKLSEFVSEVKSAANALGTKVNRAWWENGAQLLDEDCQPLSVWCRPCLGENALWQALNSLKDLQESHVEIVATKGNLCLEALPEICIDPAECFSLPEFQAQGAGACWEEAAPEENAYDYYLPDADPYSFWVSVILPFWPERFQNRNFRTFFANTIRRELPAYVAARILWVSPEKLKVFELAYRQWLVAKSCAENSASLPEEEREKRLMQLKFFQKRLACVLFDLKNEYQPATLFDCEGRDNTNVVLLDQTKLG